MTVHVSFPPPFSTQERERERERERDREIAFILSPEFSIHNIENDGTQQGKTFRETQACLLIEYHKRRRRRRGIDVPAVSAFRASLILNKNSILPRVFGLAAVRVPYARELSLFFGGRENLEISLDD